VFFFWGGAEGFGHDFCLAKEYAICDDQLHPFVRKKKGYKPTVCKLGAYVFEVGVAHILNGENEAELVLVDRFSDIGEELECSFFAFFVNLREVHDLGALGFRHCGGG